MQTEPPRPRVAQVAGRAARGVRFVIQPIAQLGELRIEALQEGFRRQAAPRFEYIALWPAAQMQRTIFVESSTPDRTAGMKSASSTQVAAASNTSGATFRQRQIFDHHHSEE